MHILGYGCPSKFTLTCTKFMGRVESLQEFHDFEIRVHQCISGQWKPTMACCRNTDFLGVTASNNVTILVAELT